MKAHNSFEVDIQRGHIQHSGRVKFIPQIILHISPGKSKGILG
jgi:hypothetical protein